MALTLGHDKTNEGAKYVKFSAFVWGVSENNTSCLQQPQDAGW